jgi:hypothetical protein
VTPNGFESTTRFLTRGDPLTMKRRESMKAIPTQPWGAFREEMFGNAHTIKRQDIRVTFIEVYPLRKLTFETLIGREGGMSEAERRDS